MKKALVFAAHGDDETTLGGTIRKLVNLGWKVHVIVGSLEIGEEKRTETELKRAIKLLGASYELLDFRRWAENYRQVVSVFDARIRDFKPDLVFTHWIEDSHTEHKLITRAVVTACRRSKISILAYREPTTGGPPVSREFNPRFFVDISETFETKIEAIKAYASQAEKYKYWIQATEGSASYYGAQIQTKYAEAFEVIRLVEIF